MRADQRHVAPREAALQHQRVVAVVLGDAPHHHEKRRLEPSLAAVEIDHAAVRTLQQHVVQPDVGAALRLDLVGALVDDAEAHVLQHRHALRQRDRPRKVHTFRPTERCSSSRR